MTIFFFAEVFLFAFLFYGLRDTTTITEADVYKIKTKVVYTDIFSSTGRMSLYITTTNGNFVTSGHYVESFRYCEQLATLLLEDSEVELTVLKNSESFYLYFGGQASTVVGIESSTEVYSSMELYNEYQESQRRWVIPSFIALQVCFIGIGFFFTAGKILIYVS